MAKDTTFVLRRTNDYFFKYVFGSEEGTDVLIDFLNATQNRPPNNRIKTVKLEDREIDPERYMDKAIRLDVVATTELGHVYQIEVQGGKVLPLVDPSPRGLTPMSSSYSTNNLQLAFRISHPCSIPNGNWLS